MKPRAIVLLLAIAALVAKIYCAATTIGSSDVVFFYKFAKTIHEQGLLAMYQATPFFNHTPLVGWFSEAAYWLAGSDNSDKPFFVFYLRLPAIFADFFGVVALLWFQEKTGRPRSWALGLYAASPVAFMVSGYHGNVDSVMALGVLLAGIACAVNRPALCGLCLGLACNIKIIPLVIAPAFFFMCWQRRQTLRFMIPAVLTVLIGWSYPLLTIPQTFLKNVLGYGSIWGVWGITYALRLTDLPSLRNIAFTNPTPEQAAIISGLKLVIVVLALVVAWRRRKAEPIEIFQTLALIWAVFFVFAPGFGAQYLAWIMPCFLVANERWFAWLMGASSVALLVFYDAISGSTLLHGKPWRQGLTVHSIAEKWTWALVLPWLVLAAFLAWHSRAVVAKPAGELEPQAV
jgi:hypothetical protein